MAATVLTQRVGDAPRQAPMPDHEPIFPLSPTDFETYVNYLKVAPGADLAANQIQIMMSEETEDPRTVVVRDIRPKLGDYTLDKDGAEVMPMSAKYDLLAKDDDTYFAELDRYLKDLRDLIKKK